MSEIDQTIHNPFSLKGKTFLITGASSGIGKSTAIEVSKSGGTVIITGRNQSNLNATFQSLQGENNSQFVADLASKEELSELISKLPKLDGIVHCAGLTKNVPFKFATRDDLNEVFEVNFYAPVELTRSLLSSKKIAKEGAIVFVSSISGVYCSAVASSIYSASKGAVNGLIKGLALDVAKMKIRVNSVNPGMIDASIFREGRITEEQLDIDKSKYPLKRYGKPEEVAYAIMYLLSDASKWVTGTNLVIDGGYTLM